LVRKEVKECDIVFDIGANLGLVTLVMAKLVGDKGYVHAIEPVPQNYDVLRKNITLNGYDNRVIANCIGASDEDGKIPFFFSNKSNLGSFCKTTNSNGKIIKIPSITIDTYTRDFKKLPVFYKMDVEGFEAKILDGMQETIRRSQSGTKIIIEVHPQFYNDELDMESSLRKMVNIGMRFKYIISAGVSQPDLFKAKGYEPFKVVSTFGWERGIYENIDTEDAILFSSKKHEQNCGRKGVSPKIVRAIMLEKQ
jgi:FkbM family methyltransferase